MAIVAIPVAPPIVYAYARALCSSDDQTTSTGTNEPAEFAAF